MEETFVKKLQIEARVMGDICLNHIIPAAISYQNVLIGNLKGCKDCFGDDASELSRTAVRSFREISTLINSLSDGVTALVEARRKANRVASIPERARLYSTEVMQKMAKVREAADSLEMLVDDAFWPLPKYRELLSL